MPSGREQTARSGRKRAAVPLGTWIEERLSNAQVRRIFARLMPPETPMFFLVMVLGYLARGYLSRPHGGTQSFRNALIENYRAMGGEARLHETVDEIRVEGDRAVGVRLSDGTDISGDYVISTSSAPETVFRLLGGRYGASELRKRLETWKLFDPIVLVSYGVAAPLADVPPTLLIDRIRKLDVGGRENEHLYLRIYNDDPAMAPEGDTPSCRRCCRPTTHTGRGWARTTPRRKTSSPNGSCGGSKNTYRR